MKEIINNVFERELKYDNVVVLTYKIEYPSIRYYNIFNKYNLKNALNLKEKCETELFNEAVELYKNNKKNGYPIMVYEIIKDYHITFNQNNMLSLYSDEYTFSGGAHGNTIRTSQTWNLNYQRMIPLYYFFDNNPYFIINVLKKINSEIKENPEIYFENYCNLVLETFDVNNFYIIPKNIIIYFQQYDIAPYSSGIPIFKVR